MHKKAGCFFTLLLLVLIIIVPSKSFAVSSTYLSISGGYGNYSGMYKNDGTTQLMRLALGEEFYIKNFLAIGAESGVQTGNRMRLANSALVAFQPSILPVFITLKPVVDLLAVMHRDINEKLFFSFKVGIAYFNAEVENAMIPNVAQILPEIQLGMGFIIAKNTAFVINYQNIFGHNPVLVNVDNQTGTANLNQLPRLQSILLGIEINL